MRSVGQIKPVAAYLLAGLIMIYASYSMPRLLPGDFVTAMYSSSHVTLTADQEKEIRAYYSRQEGFGHYLVDLLTLNLLNHMISKG